MRTATQADCDRATRDMRGCTQSQPAQQAQAQSVAVQASASLREAFGPSIKDCQGLGFDDPVRAETHGMRAETRGVRAEAHGVRAETHGVRAEPHGVRGQGLMSPPFGSRFGRCGLSSWFVVYDLGFVVCGLWIVVRGLWFGVWGLGPGCRVQG